MGGLTALALVVALAASACSQRLDETRVSLCRMTLPALNPPGSDIRIVRVQAGEGERSIRIDYMVSNAPLPGLHARATAGPRRAFVECGFSVVPFSEIEPRLESITTEAGPVSGASVYLLQRFWLRTPEAIAADPGR
jgi:hypothetical protein